MSKITFRADDDLVRQLEEFDASKSEVMREALRTYLEGDAPGEERETTASDTTGTAEPSTLDDALAERIDELLDRRLDDRLSEYTRQTPQDVNVNVSLDGVHQETAGPTEERQTSAEERKTRGANEAEPPQTARNTCSQCGDELSGEQVYCPNCGEKASHRVFCECGDELRSDWAFCPGCGRRTPAADVLDRP
jgi:Arc/MetJ-type ribon-helix-helix transcriptional regulator